MADETPNIERDLAALNPPQLTAEYLKHRSEYRALSKRAMRVSRGSGRIWVEGNRLAYASILFTRIVVSAKSIASLLPDCKAGEHWDFSSVASLSRNLAESYLWYFWLCEDEIDPDVRQGRFILLYCHDHGSRGRLFPDSAPEHIQKEVMDDLIQRFDANPFLKTYGEKARREALKGLKTPFIQDDVIDKMDLDKETFRTVYRFFSQHTHGGPVAFFRQAEHVRGSGVETRHEKSYMIMAIIFIYTILSRAIEGHLKLFPDAETRGPALTDREVAYNVEVNEWRLRPKRHP